jgi:hypothetical protein
VDMTERSASFIVSCMGGVPGSVASSVNCIEGCVDRAARLVLFECCI